MPDPDRTAITAESLKAREEWTRGFPDAELAWEETADEGKGIGFDGLDPSAMVRAMYRVLVELPGWPVPEDIVGMTMFEVLFQASSRPGVVPGESKTFLA